MSYSRGRSSPSFPPAATAAKGGPYRLDGRRQLDYTLLVLPIDGMEGEAANFSIF